jgi:hypothetical protein
VPVPCAWKMWCQSLVCGKCQSPKTKDSQWIREEGCITKYNRDTTKQEINARDVTEKSIHCLHAEAILLCLVTEHRAVAEMSSALYARGREEWRQSQSLLQRA